jgi:predicted O-methyltransferase YrrM
VKFDEVDAAVTGVQFMKTKQGRQVYDFLLEHKLSRVLELGFAHGKSTCYLAAATDELGGHVVTMDKTGARDRSPNIHQLLDKTGLSGRVTPVFAETSYTWELMKLLDQDPPPRFDFAYIDGGHTWDVTGYGFFLVDRLLAPGGWMLFDDLDWTIAGSRGLRNSGWAHSLPEEQRTTPQVRKVFELLVKAHPGYDQVHEQDGWGWARKRPASGSRWGLRRG